MQILEVLKKFKQGKISEREVEKALKLDYIKRINNHTTYDFSRELRKSIPEIIFAENKTPKQLLEIFLEVLKRKDLAISTRASEKHFKEVKKVIKDAKFSKSAKIIFVDRRKGKIVKGKVGILTAGTSDIPIGEEAKVVCELMNCKTITFYDVGVAGIHRIIEPLKKFIKEDVDVIIVIAGMEGALPSIIASLVDVPVIGVPTSIGYGLGEKGLGALISMLQSCSPGLVVVNIDAGFNAGITASLIVNRVWKGEIR